MIDNKGRPMHDVQSNAHEEMPDLQILSADKPADMRNSVIPQVFGL